LSILIAPISYWWSSASKLLGGCTHSSHIPCLLLLLLLLQRSSPGLVPALANASQLLQQHPQLAAALAALSSRVSHAAYVQPQQLSQQAYWQDPYSRGNLLRSKLLFPPHHVQQQHLQRGPANLACCTADSAPGSTRPAGSAGADTAGAASSSAANTPTSTAAGQHSITAGSPDAAAAAAALAKLQQVMQRQPAQLQAANMKDMHASLQQHASSRAPNSSSNIASDGGSSTSRVLASRVGQQLSQPQRPALDPAAATAAQEAQQRGPAKQQRLLAWRSQGKAGTAAAAAAAGAVQEAALQQQQQLQEAQHAQQAQQQASSPAGTGSMLQPQQQQQQQLPLEPSIVDGRAYLTSPVSFVAAGTLTRRLAGSISAAFALHQHQLLFAVGPHPLGVAVKALATARRMLGEDNGGRPVHILMQPTLRGGRTPMRSQSYALDITRVGELPMQPGIAGRQAVILHDSSSSSGDGDDASIICVEQLQQLQQQQQAVVPWADAKVVHITSSSNELAAARSLVENMPARGQTVMRAMGPYATETAVLALALARPLMQARHGQDLVAVVLWNEQQQRRTYKPGRESGLLLAVFRCEAGSFPPRVLLLPPSQRSSKRQEFWRQRGQRTPAAGRHQQQQQQQ
jgi:stage V sporulation protein SpoVS